MKSKTIVLIILFLISVATLVMAIFGDNRQVFAVATVISHVLLVLFGFFYARSSRESMLDELRRDILGK